MTYDGTFTYTYDCENRLIAVTQGYNTVATYKYDWAGRRVIRYTNFGLIATRYCYDGARVIDESGYTMIMGGYVLSDRKQYVYGEELDEPLMMARGTGTITRYFYHYDGLGSVIALSNVNGNIVEAYDYDVFGQPSVYSGAGVDGIWFTGDDQPGSLTSGNPYLFTARRYDSETGNYYYRFRYYHPELGRFMSPDPIGYYDGMNMYAYCGNDPVNWVDPWGLEKKGIVDKVLDLFKSLRDRIPHPFREAADMAKATDEAMEEIAGWEKEADYLSDPAETRKEEIRRKRDAGLKTGKTSLKIATKMVGGKVLKKTWSTGHKIYKGAKWGKAVYDAGKDTYGDPNNGSDPNN